MIDALRKIGVKNGYIIKTLEFCLKKSPDYLMKRDSADSIMDSIGISKNLNCN